MNQAQRRKWLTVAAVGLVGLYFADRLLITPLTDMALGRSARIAELRETVDEARTLVDRADALERRWARMLESSLPTDEAEAEGLVLGSVSAWAAEAGLQVTALRPRWTEEADVRTLECRATGFGTMRQTASFLHAIETSPLALKIEEMTLAAADDAGGRLSLDIRFTGLVLTETAS